MLDYIEIIIEKEGVSDTKYEVVDVHCLSGVYAEKGSLLLSYETSKAQIDIEAPTDGYIFHNCKACDLINVGSPIIFISQNENFKIPNDQPTSIVDEVSPSKTLTDKFIDKNQTFTDLAEKLINELGDLRRILANDQVSSQNVIELVATNIFCLPYDYLGATNKLVLIGAGGMTSMAIEAINLQEKYNIVGIVDPFMEAGSKLLGVPVLGDETILDRLLEMGVTHALVTFGAIGKQHLRQDVYDRVKTLGFKMANVIHPRANLEKTAIIGDGNLILSQSDIGTNVSISNNCYINVGAKICHDSHLSNNVHLAPGSIVAGRVKIGENTLFGMGATCVYDCSIGKNVIINNNVSITGNVPDNSTIFRN